MLQVFIIGSRAPPSDPHLFWISVAGMSESVELNKTLFNSRLKIIKDNWDVCPARNESSFVLAELFSPVRMRVIMKIMHQ